jgi:hypothetical protein
MAMFVWVSRNFCWMQKVWMCRRYEAGAHASERGSDFAAKYIWDTIKTDLHRKQQ